MEIFFSLWPQSIFFSVKEPSHHVMFIWWLTILTKYQNIVYFCSRSYTTCRLENWWQYTEETYFFQLWTRYYTKTLRQFLTLLTKCQKYATFFCHVQVTFRQLLTMLAIFDLSFILCAFISFSLPQLSPHWKVGRIRIALMKIFAHCWGDYETSIYLILFLSPHRFAAIH